VRDAILYIARTACQWRMLPKDSPAFKAISTIGAIKVCLRRSIFGLLQRARERQAVNPAHRRGSSTVDRSRPPRVVGRAVEPDGVDGPLTASMCQSWVVNNANGREPSMTEVTTIGLDLAKTIFQVHGVDASGAVTVRRALRRSRVLAFFDKLPPCRPGWHRGMCDSALLGTRDCQAGP
jgi:hypothetical protein